MSQEERFNCLVFNNVLIFLNEHLQSRQKNKRNEENKRADNQENFATFENIKRIKTLLLNDINAQEITQIRKNTIAIIKGGVFSD